MIVEKAHAKINVCLHVLGKRTDGYHTLESIMVPLELHDTLELTVSPTDTIALACDDPPTANPEDNLVMRVAQAMQTRFSLRGFQIHLKKRIPVASGLGGGSADAAAALRGLNRLFNLGLSLDALAEIGLAFGADIPFCVFERPAFVQGIGEQLTFLPDKHSVPVWLGTPNIRLSTAQVFSHVTADDMSVPLLDDLLRAWAQADDSQLSTLCANSLTRAAERAEPAFAAFRRQMARRLATTVTMTGSGPTVFVIGPDAETVNHDDFADLSFRFSRLTNTL